MSREPGMFHTPQLAALLLEAARHGPDIMDQLLRQTREALQRQIDQTRDLSGRDARARAVSALTQAGPGLRARFAEVLHAAFERETEDHPATTSFESGPVSIKFEQLELMDERQVQARISAVRGLQQALLDSEAELSELNTLVSALLGLDRVMPERNPLRPEVFLQALQALTDEAGGDASLRAGWVQVMVPLLGKTLRPVYQDLLHYLKQQKVQPVRYAISRAVQAGAVAATAPSQRGAAAPTHAVVASAAAPPAAGGLTMQQLHGLVSGSAQPDSAGLVRQVVQLIIDNIAGDERLLPPVRRQIQSMAPLLLRLAQGDPHFFSDKNHPARLLLEEMAQRSFAFDSEQATGFGDFLQQLRQSQSTLDAAAGQAAAFESVLEKLRRHWAQEDRLQQARRQAALQALQHAERRNQLARELAAQIRARPTTVLVPDAVVDFACGPWAQVMAQARQDGAAALQTLNPEALLEDLFWSVRPDQNRQQPARLVKLIPQLLKGLRQGLEQIHYPAEQLQQFLDQLLVLHQGGLEGAVMAGTRAARPAPRPEAQPWLAPEEARDSGFMDDLDLPALPAEVAEDEPERADFPSTEPMGLEEMLALRATPEPASLPAAAAFPLEALHPGTWVELETGGHWTRLQLNWVNDPGTLCLFAGPGGSNHSMTRRMLDRLLAEGRLRLVSQGAVVERAFDAVAELAMRNSVFMDLQAEPGSTA